MDEGRFLLLRVRRRRHGRAGGGSETLLLVRERKGLVTSVATKTTLVVDSLGWESRFEAE